MGTHTHIKAFSYVIIQINGCQQLFFIEIAIIF